VRWCLSNPSSFLSEGRGCESSLSVGGTTLLQGPGGDFLGGMRRGPPLEDDIKRSGENTFEDGCDSEYSEDRNKGRPAHCEIESRKMSTKWVKWDRPKNRHPFHRSLYTLLTILTSQSMEWERNFHLMCFMLTCTV